MSTSVKAAAASPTEAPRASWLPMIIIGLAQIQMVLNVNALPVSIGPIVEEFETSPTTISTALVVYSLAVAAFVMLGAKLGKIIGARLIFQIGVVLHGLAMLGIALSPSAYIMVFVQLLAGLAAAILVPSLVVLIAVHYKGPQQAQALGYLGAAQASAGVAAFIIVGTIGTVLSWRIPFGMIAMVAVVVLFLSFRLKSVPKQSGVSIDWIGVLLAALSITLISLGFNFLNAWGLFLATPNAPFAILGASPAPIMIVVGVMLGQAFFAWSLKREAFNRSTLLALEVLDTRVERATTFALFIISGLGPAVNFLIPLYIQIVQGRTGLQTAVSVIPYSLAIFTGTAFIVRAFGRLTPRQIGWIGFVVVSIGLTMLAFTIQNEWGTPLVILSLIVLGLGEGSLLTLVFNVLVSASPKELAGDVGALRGTTNNLSTAVGTAIAGALSVGLLTAIIGSYVASSPILTPQFTQQLDLASADFVSNDQLLDVLSATTATPAEIEEAVQINTEARLRALKLSFLFLAVVALVAIVPATFLPDYIPEEIPSS